MLQNKSKEIKCPNCDHIATGNYCSQCGQATHLHNDSFLGLVAHFISHYFHFENKFWVTLKTLIIHPGSLDIAYFKKQRERYIQPISLYIFISVAFFIVAAYTVRFSQITTVDKNGEFTMVDEWTFGFHDMLRSEVEQNRKWVVDYNTDSLRKVKKGLRDLEDGRKDYFRQPDNKFQFSPNYFYVTFYNYFVFPYAYRHQMYDIDAPVSEIYTEFFHLLPKIFFLLMPLMALLLYMVFFSCKQYRFVNYAVFSLHTHALMFVSAIFLLLVVGSVTDASEGLWTGLFLLVIPLAHFILSCRNFFGKGWIYTILVGIFTFTLYILLVLLVAVAVLLLFINYS